MCHLCEAETEWEKHTHTQKMPGKGEEKEIVDGSKNERTGKALTGSKLMTGSRLKFR